MYAGHLDLTHDLVWTVDDALPMQVCARYIDRFRSAIPEEAPITGRDGPVVDPATRSNTRTMWDDPAEAGDLLDRVRHAVPDRSLGLAIAGANPRLRLYRYGPGQHHGAHWDDVVLLDGGVRSLLTLVFYLNDDFEGGRTTFPELGEGIAPRAGRALLFQHRILHAAEAVIRGEKFVLRTDVLYGPGSRGGVDELPSPGRDR